MSNLFSSPLQSLSILGAGWLGSAVATACFQRFHLQVSSRDETKRAALCALAQAAGSQIVEAAEWAAKISSTMAQATDVEPTAENVDRPLSPTLTHFLADAGANVSSSARLFSAQAIDLPKLQAQDAIFFQSEALLITIPPGRSRDDLQTQYLAELAAALEAAEAGGCRQLIYTSSTGVYGGVEGRVDEQSLTLPDTPSAKAVLAAEALLSNSSIPLTILRLAGLYGPDRHPGRWFGGKASIPQADAPVNLVHQTDVVQAILLVLQQGPRAGIFNVCAAAHPSKGSFYTQAAAALGLGIPTTTPGGATQKQVDSQKIRADLGWQPQYDGLPLDWPA